MNEKLFAEAMSELDAKYIDEALNYRKKAKKPLGSSGALSRLACAWLLSAVCFSIRVKASIPAFLFT
ncbi:MAG: hypothetical protein LUE06_01370 [Oscillospiraceae bacterium]|nr:hypothetical protein [Oscillospiraceae bacterium]